MGSIRKTFITLVLLGILAMIAIPVANADNGDPVRAGMKTTATASTIVDTTQGTGMAGTTSSLATESVGVLGNNTGAGPGVWGLSANSNGVFGRTTSSTASGVYGENNFGGYGVAGRSGDGVGVLAESTNGVALRTTGKLEFQNRSGVTTVASGTKSKTVSHAGVTTNSMVIATVQRTGGFFVQAAVPAAGSFTIYLNKAPVSPATVKVAYMVLN